MTVTRIPSEVIEVPDFVTMTEPARFCGATVLVASGQGPARCARAA